MMGDRLKGKICLITGTGGSMGREVALLFSQEGATIVGCDVNPESAAMTVRVVEEAGGTMVSMHPCDLTKKEDCQSLVDLVIQRFGRIDVLYNNAARTAFNWIDDIPQDEWYRNMDEEVHLVFLLTQAAWPHLKATRGTVVNVASATAWRTFRSIGALAHSTAKAAVVAMTRHMAMEGREFGIRVNSISPGLIATNQTRDQMADPAWMKSMLDYTLLNRVGTPREVANAALFLASDESSYVTATDLSVDGGVLA